MCLPCTPPLTSLSPARLPSSLPLAVVWLLLCRRGRGRRPAHRLPVHLGPGVVQQAPAHTGHMVLRADPAVPPLAAGPGLELPGGIDTRKEGGEGAGAGGVDPRTHTAAGAHVHQAGAGGGPAGRSGSGWQWKWAVVCFVLWCGQQCWCLCLCLCQLKLAWGVCSRVQGGSAL
jgi:hypothetical protein